MVIGIMLIILNILVRSSGIVMMMCSFCWGVVVYGTWGWLADAFKCKIIRRLLGYPPRQRGWLLSDSAWISLPWDYVANPKP